MRTTYSGDGSDTPAASSRSFTRRIASLRTRENSA